MFLVLGYRQLLGHSNCWFEQLFLRNLRGWCQFLLLVQNMGRTGESASSFVVCNFLAFFRTVDYRWYLGDTRLCLFVAKRERWMRSWGVGVDSILFFKHKIDTHIWNRFTWGGKLGLSSCVHARIQVLHVSWTGIWIALKLKGIIQNRLVVLFPLFISPQRRILPLLIRYLHNNWRMRVELQIIEVNIVNSHLKRLLWFLL